MSADNSYNLAIIRYYAREKYYHHIQQLVLECEQKSGAGSELTFWRAYSLAMESSISEAMRELETIQDKRDTVLCSAMLLVYAHKKCKTIDRDTVHALEKKIKTERQTCGERALYLAGMYLWLSGRHDKAREYIERALKMSTKNIEALILHGWIDLTCGRDSAVKKSMKYFEEALSISTQPQPLDGLLGKVQYYVTRCHFSHALEVINQAIASYPDCLPTLLVKTHVQLTLQDWEQSVETAQRCLQVDTNCIEAIRVIALSLLAQEGNYSQASVKLGELLSLLDRFEPSNHHLYYDMSLAFTRLCGRSSIVLQQTCALLERAIQLAPTNAVYVTELAHVLKLQGNSRESIQTYEKAFQLDETSVPALSGTIYWQVMDGKLDEAEQQIEFLTEIQSSIGKNTELLYVSALLAQKRNKPSSRDSSDNPVMTLLQEAVDVHFALIKGQPFGIHYFKLLDPDLLIQITRIILSYTPTEPGPPGSAVPMVLKRCTYVLEPLMKFTPGLIDVQFLLTKITYLSGNLESAQGVLQRCLDQHEGFCDGHLLMAEICLHMKAPKMAESSLEKALSHSFDVQSSPFYHLLKARVEKQLGNHVEAFRTLTTALSVIKSKKTDIKPARPHGQIVHQQQLSISDEVSVYLELCEAYCQLNRLTEAKELMEEAAKKFESTSQGMRISITNADLAIASGNIEQALSALKAVGPDHPHYAQARKKMADIFLKHQKNKEQYIQCYKELASQQPGTQSALLLGDAYMSIQEPDKAIEVYETALKKNPREATLASKIGQALVRTHNYNKAVNYYESALKSLDQHGQLQYVLRLDLANLYLKIRNYNKAERTLQTCLEHPEDNQLSVLIEDTRCLQLLARVYQKSGSSQQAFKALSNAREVQNNVLKRVGMEQPEAVQDQNNVASTIAFTMAEHALQEQNYETAERFYREAILHNSDHYESHLALAKLYMSQENLKPAEHELVTVLQTFPNDDNATLMLADLKFHSNDYTNAIAHYKQILSRKPSCYKALAQLVEMLRRAGQLDDATPLLTAAENSSSRASYDPGFSYCQGLYHWYRSDPTTALQKFNQSRKDSEWGEKALMNMIEICLNPDNETVGGETFKAIEEDHTSTSAAEKQDSDMMALHTAERFIKELRPKTTTARLRQQVLSSYTLLASKKKPDAEQALQRFVDIASGEKDFIPALLGMATAHMILKQTPKARNQLKRISKLPWSTLFADDFEKSWLLLSDIYIQTGKYDLANELLTKKCLHYNKSCYKAWEYIGYIAEKEQAFQDAAHRYESAWKYCYQTGPNIGYKLAFNYLKAKRFIEAIDICHVILAVNPNYPKIRKEILDKARLAIRA